MIPIQTTIVGYAGKPITLFSAYDENSKVLVISVESDYWREPRDGCLVVTNDLNIARDILFTEDNLLDAVTAFFAMYNGMAVDGRSNRLTFSERATRSNPVQSIEKDGIDTNGQKYRIAESVTCAQVATLATCHYAHTRAGAVNASLDMFDQLIITI